MADLLRKRKSFAFLLPTTPLQRIQQRDNGTNDAGVQEKLDNTTKIVMSAMGHTWVINHPDIKEPKKYVLYNEDTHVHLDKHLMINGREWPHLQNALHEVDRLMIDGATRSGASADEDIPLLDQCMVTTRLKYQTVKSHANPKGSD